MASAGRDVVCRADRQSAQARNNIRDDKLNIISTSKSRALKSLILLVHTIAALHPAQLNALVSTIVGQGVTSSEETHLQVLYDAIAASNLEAIIRFPTNEYFRQIDALNLGA